MSAKHTDIAGRTAQFSRNDSLEGLLRSLNIEMWEAERLILPGSKEMEKPLIFVMGPLRSGTTLFMQWLANTGLVAYPTNLLSRFYQAPILGAKIQQLLTDPRFNFRDELGEFSQQAEYKSENGKTKGVLAPNEFWYFWRRFLAEPSRDVWMDAELHESMDVATMKAELIGMMDVLQKPFAAKAMLFNYNIPFLNSIFDKALFIQLRRDEVTNVMSVLDARKRQLGSESAWYSFKIPEYEKLKDLDPLTQSAGQIHHINRAVTSGMDKVDESRKLVIQYEKFCKDPSHYFQLICEKIEQPSADYLGPAQFRPSRKPEGDLAVKIEQVLQKFSS